MPSACRTTYFIQHALQAQLSGQNDVLDEEVGALSEAVVRLKGMATAIGEESRETAKVQDAIAKQLEAAQVRSAAFSSPRSAGFGSVHGLAADRRARLALMLGSLFRVCSAPVAACLRSVEPSASICETAYSLCDTICARSDT